MRCPWRNLPNNFPPWPKVKAFEQSLEQVYNHFAKIDASYYGVVFDQDISPKPKEAEYFILNKNNPPFCALFAEASSHLTAGITMADIFCGACTYTINKQDAENLPEIEVHLDLYIRLDDFFEKGFVSIFLENSDMT